MGLWVDGHMDKYRRLIINAHIYVSTPLSIVCI